MKKPFKIRRHRSKTGLPPGTLIHTGERKIETPVIRIIDYTVQNISKHTVDSVAECQEYRHKDSVTWINVDGLHEVELLKSIGEQYQLHPLVLEDILSTDQRPKIEMYDEYMYIVSRMLSFSEETGQISDEQFSLILGPNFVLTFQEKKGDVFDPVRQRMENEKSRLRNNRSDYLAYALIDAIVDHYFILLDQLGERIIGIEERLMNEPGEDIMEEIHNLKREMISLRGAIWPMREVIAQIHRGESDLFAEKTLLFLRDVYDHTIQVVDTVESYRDMLSGLMDLYLSTLSNRMNEVMKVLTIIATIFIPLTFIAGIYGMNFEHMPELGLPWAYPAVWGIMIGVVIIMLLYFRRKKWL